jgi:hypothetical protein
VALNRATVDDPITVNSDGNYTVRVLFWDSADPANAGVQPGQIPASSLWDEPMNVSGGATVPQLIAVVTARGQAIRQNLANQADARAVVPVGSTITIV